MRDDGWTRRRSRLSTLKHRDLLELSWSKRDPETDAQGTPVYRVQRRGELPHMRSLFDFAASRTCAASRRRDTPALSLELDAVGAVLCHGPSSSESSATWLDQQPDHVRIKWPTPIGWSFCPGMLKDNYVEIFALGEGGRWEVTLARQERLPRGPEVGQCASDSTCPVTALAKCVTGQARHLLIVICCARLSRFDGEAPEQSVEATHLRPAAASHEAVECYWGTKYSRATQSRTRSTTKPWHGYGSRASRWRSF